MSRAVVILVVLLFSTILAANAMAKQEPSPIPIIPAVLVGGCIDFNSDTVCGPGDADADGYHDWLEGQVGSDPYNAASTPEYALLDEQQGHAGRIDRSEEVDQIGVVIFGVGGGLPIGKGQPRP